MNSKNCQPIGWRGLFTVFICFYLWFAWSPLAVQAESGFDESVGAYIELRIDSAPMEAWAVVQWQDNLGVWHNVDGWQHQLIDNNIRLWVAPKDFGSGPFRWTVTKGEVTLLGVSAPFTLPNMANEVLQIAICMPTAESSVDICLSSSFAHYQHGDYEQAIVDYTKAIELDPNYALAYNWRGNAYHLSDNLEQAIMDYNKAIELDPEYAAAFNNRGLANQASDNLKQTIADYTKAIELDPKHVLAYNNRGNAYHDAGSLDLALVDYNKAIELGLGLISASTSQGEAYASDGNLEQAVIDYTKAINVGRGLILAYNNRGWSYYELGDLEQAITDYTQAIMLDPKYSTAYNNRGLAHHDADNLEQAIVDYTKAIELDPEYIAAYNNRGNAYRDSDHLHLAFPDYSKAIELDPEYILAYNNRGWAYYKSDNLELAFVDYTKAIKLDPKSALAYNRRGVAYRKLGDLEQAVADYTKAIELDPEFETAYNNRALIYAITDNLDLAIADFTSAIELDPEDELAYYNRGVAHCYHGYLEPDIELNYYKRGGCSQHGNIEQAIADYTKAIELDPEFVPAYNNRGLAYAVTGNLTQAIADTERYLELNPNVINEGLVITVIRIMMLETSEIETKYSFEKDTAGWVRQDYTDSQAVLRVLQSDEYAKEGHYSLKMQMDLVAGDAHKSQGEAWVDLQANPPDGEFIPIDLTNRAVTAWVYVPVGFTRSRTGFTSIRLFVKDENWNSEYGASFSVKEGQWFRISLLVTDSEKISELMDPEFDPSRIIAIGVKMEVGPDYSINGPVYIDAIGW